VIRNAANTNKNEFNELVSFDTLVERLKRLRALNRDPEKMGLTQYTWRTFSIDKMKGR
jgi:hypothetical protein